jgi:hypothetical protein
MHVDWTLTVRNQLLLYLLCRLAMLGFAGMVATEMITGVNVLQAWGLQPLTTLASSTAL